MLGEIGFPVSMMGFTSGSDVGFNATLLDERHRVWAPVTVIQGNCGGGAERVRDTIQGGECLVMVGGMIGQPLPHDQIAGLLDCRLDIVMLIEALIAAVFHDAGVGVGEVVLIPIVGSGLRWLGG